MIQQEINLNLIPSSEPVVVHCNQYDEGKSRIIAHLYNGSHPYTPGANATVKVQGTKPDDHAFQYWCEISGSTVTVDVNIQMTAVAGRTPTQLIVNETSGVTGSFAFYLDVQASTLPPDIDVSETDLPILTEEAQEAARRAVQAAGAAEDSADRAASWSSNPPYIGANFNWYVYDIVTEQFVDSGILARGTDGEDGERGSLWYRGTAVSGKSADPTVFPTGIADALAGDMYLNTTEGAVYHCVTGGSASVATWAYDFTLTGGGGGGGTDNYNDLINQPKVNGVTLVGNKTSDDLGINSNIMLSSIMHIGGETQRTVQEALEALKDNGGGLYPYLYIDSEAGATVTVDAPDGSTIIPTPAGSGHWECELPAYGVYVIHSVLSGQGDATYSLTVDDVKEYHITDSHYDFTINVIADAGSTIRVSAGTEVYTGTGTGSAVAFVVHQPSTVYTVEETLDGHTDSETVTSASTSGGSVTVTVHVFEAILNISTTSASLYGKSISIMKGGVSVGSTAFNNSGQATYAVHETGIYTLTCDGYDASVTVTTETTYPVSILAGLDLASWISAGSTTEHPLNPSSYADFAALEADEEAIRQLMTVHDAVDYLAQAIAGDSLMESVIGSDICAKWINLSDYALDTLSANTDIKSVMDTADKYGYGEWVITDGTTTPVTWGALGNVPIMTANNAPYGVASASTEYNDRKAYVAFSQSATANAHWLPSLNQTNNYLRYTFVNPVKAKKAKINFYRSPSHPARTFSIRGSNDGFSTYDVVGTATLQAQSGGTVGNIEIEVDLTSSTYYMAYELFCADDIFANDYNIGVHTLQFYGRELKPLVPTMTSNTTPKGEASASTFYDNNHVSYKAFNPSEAYGWTPKGDDVAPNCYIQYKLDEPNKVLVVGAKGVGHTSGSTKITYNGVLYGSNDNFATRTELGNVTMIGDDLTINTVGSSIVYNYYRVYLTSNSTGESRFTHGNGMKFQFYGMDYSEKEFAPGSTRKTIYDHGVELVEIVDAYSNGFTPASGYTAEGTIDKRSNGIYVATTANAKTQTATTKDAISLNGYDYIAGIMDAPCIKSKPLVIQGSTTKAMSSVVITKADISAGTSPFYFDITSENRDLYLLAGSANGTYDGILKELWLE